MQGTQPVSLPDLKQASQIPKSPEGALISHRTLIPYKAANGSIQPILNYLGGTMEGKGVPPSSALGAL